MTLTTDEELLALLAVDGHVMNDLSWLLTSAIEFTNRYESGALIVVLQDSALMHGRALIEFACMQPKSDYFRLADFVTEGAVVTTGMVPWTAWIDFMNSQTSHLLRKRDPGISWPHDMTYNSRDRMQRLADDLLKVFEANADRVRPGLVQARFAEVVCWGRGHLDRLEPPSPILPAPY